VYIWSGGVVRTDAIFQSWNFSNFLTRLNPLRRLRSVRRLNSVEEGLSSVEEGLTSDEDLDVESSTQTRFQTSFQRVSLWAPQIQEDEDELINQSSTQARAQTPFQRWQEEEEEEEEEEVVDPFPAPSWADRLAQEGKKVDKSLTPFQSVRLLSSQMNHFFQIFQVLRLGNHNSCRYSWPFKADTTVDQPLTQARNQTSIQNPFFR